MTKHEAILLKQRISSHLISHPFEQESIAQSSVINRISNTKLREQLYQQYRNTAEQARNNMMTIAQECADDQQKQCHEQYQIQMTKTEKHQNTLPINERLTSSMWNIIKQRLTNMIAHIQCVYKFKTELIHLH